MIAFPALFLLKTETSCERLTDAFLYRVKVSLKLSSESKQKLASQSPQPKWVILPGNCTLWFSGHLKLGSIACPWQRLIPVSVWIPAVLQQLAHDCNRGPAEQTRSAIHFGQGDRKNCTLQKPLCFQKSHKKHQQWYLTQNKMDLLNNFKKMSLCKVLLI